MIHAALVSEGGAFRGLYAGGVMDSLLKNRLYFETTVGVSAGALCGANYVSRQYRRTLTLNRIYRKDPRYVGKDAIKNSSALIDVGFIFSEEVSKKCPLDEAQLYGGGQEFYMVATDCKTGRPAYFSHREVDIRDGLRATTSLPFMAPVVPIGDSVYLDGGLSDYNPALWALERYDKVVVICSRPLSYVKDPVSRGERIASSVKYREYPNLINAIFHQDDLYNRTRRVLRQLEAEGRIFVLQPSDPALSISRLEGNLERMTAWYLLGERDTDTRIAELKAYLGV